jgi:hypothetical protein
VRVSAYRRAQARPTEWTLDFHASQGVDGSLIVSASTRSVTWLSWSERQYEQAEQSWMLLAESWTDAGNEWSDND